ncbi:MAG: 30S ribosomal protein S4 [Patescibacteria group bacterium]
MPLPTQQHQRRRPTSRYAQQMLEKQSLKEIYGLREEQLKTYYRQALSARGETGPYIIRMLERRLDNAVFRSGIAQTRPQARQMVTHGLFLVNGRGADIPSRRLTVGDVIAIKEGKRKKALFDNFEKRMQGARLPNWLALDVKGYGFKVVGEPAPEEAAIGVDIRAVVEFFAR